MEYQTDVNRRSIYLPEHDQRLSQISSEVQTPLNGPVHVYVPESAETPAFGHFHVSNELMDQLNSLMNSLVQHLCTDIGRCRFSEKDLQRARALSFRHFHVVLTQSTVDPRIAFLNEAADPFIFSRTGSQLTIRNMESGETIQADLENPTDAEMADEIHNAALAIEVMAILLAGIGMTFPASSKKVLDAMRKAVANPVIKEQIRRLAVGLAGGDWGGVIHIINNMLNAGNFNVILSAFFEDTSELWIVANIGMMVWGFFAMGVGGPVALAAKLVAIAWMIGGLAAKIDSRGGMPPLPQPPSRAGLRVFGGKRQIPGRESAVPPPPPPPRPPRVIEPGYEPPPERPENPQTPPKLLGDGSIAYDR